MLRAAPFNLFDATVVGASSLAGLLWPAAGPTGFTCTLPVLGSGDVAPIKVSGAVCGGVVAPDNRTPAFLIDFAAVGTAEQVLIVEIGKLHVLGGVAMPLGSVSITSSTQTVANVNPLTGVPVAATTFRMFDTISTTAKGQLDQLITNVGGAADDTIGQLLLAADEAQYYYAVITTLPGGLTEVICAITPSERRLVVKTAP